MKRGTRNMAGVNKIHSFLKNMALKVELDQEFLQWGKFLCGTEFYNFFRLKTSNVHASVSQSHTYSVCYGGTGPLNAA